MLREIDWIGMHQQRLLLLLFSWRLDHSKRVHVFCYEVVNLHKIMVFVWITKEEFSLKSSL